MKKLFLAVLAASMVSSLAFGKQIEPCKNCQLIVMPGRVAMEKAINQMKERNEHSFVPSQDLEECIAKTDLYQALSDQALHPVEISQKLQNAYHRYCDDKDYDLLARLAFNVLLSKWADDIIGNDVTAYRKCLKEHSNSSYSGWLVSTNLVSPQ